jgi:hypothetical protein
MYLRAPPFNRQLNLTKDANFSKSNRVFVGILKNMRRGGKDTTTHKSLISKSDMEKLYSSGVLNNSTPQGLIWKVFFELSLHFIRRGREGLRELHKTSYLIKKDDAGIEYIVPAYHEAEKTKQGNEKENKEKEAVMYAQYGPRCPVHSYKLYISKLNPECQALFQYPKPNCNITDNVWYNKKPVGKKSLSEMMKRISVAGELSEIHMNHCIRATSITVLH